MTQSSWRDFRGAAPAGDPPVRFLSASDLSRIRRGLPRWALLACLTASLAGCGTFRSYRAEMEETLGRVASGDLDGAARLLKNNAPADARDLLYHLETSEIRRLQGDYGASFEALSAADAVVQAWEDATRLDPGRSLGQAGSLLLNDRVRAYEGHDYEKVLVTTRMAMDHLALGDWDNARVAIKRTHEREDVIAEIRAEEYRRLQAEARERGVTPSIREISGYPVEELETPEENALRNGYQNALSHYLAGYVYEALGEPSLAAPGYRKAIELRPGQALLESALAGLDARTSAPDDGTCDLLVVVESGAVAGRESRSFSLPVPVFPSGIFMQIPVSFPVIPPSPSFTPPEVLVDQSEAVPTAHILDLDAMARRALKDEMPAIMMRAFVRSATKAVAQYQMQRQMMQRGRRNDDGAALGAAVALIAMQIGGAVVEQADERGWRMLPSQVSLARVKLPHGRHTLNVRSPAGAANFEVNLRARHALVTVRLLRGRAFVSPVGEPGAAPPSADAPSARSLPGPATEPLYARTVTFEFPPTSSPSRRSMQ